jgi:hypothetical protein
MDTQTNAVAPEQTPRREHDGKLRSHWEQPLVEMRNELVQLGQRHGHVESKQWQTALARMDALGVPSDDQARLRAELSQLAAAQQWLFPDEAAPADPASRLDILVGRARVHAHRTRLITQGYLSTLLALGAAWGLAHDEIAQALARTCVAERWQVDWEIACEMEGLLGAEQAGDHQHQARSDARVAFERRGRKGWLSSSDLVHVYSSLRVHGVVDAEVRELLAGFHHDANARHWAWAGPTEAPPTAESGVPMLVDKVAEQVRRTGRIQPGFRHALMAEAAGARIDTSQLLEAIEARRQREFWGAEFDRRGQFDVEDPDSWWPWIADRLRALLAPTFRPVVPSGLRMAMPLLMFLTVVSLNRPIASPQLSGPQPVAAAASLAAPAVAPPSVAASGPVSTPAPVVIQPLTLVVAHTDGAGARLRTAPATGPVARLLSEGTAVVVIGSEMQVGGTAWAQVRAPDGTPGWMSADLLSPAQADPSAG